MSELMIGVIADDSEWLDLMRQVFNERVALAALDTYLYPDDLLTFCERANLYDYLIIEHDLGGKNGASLAQKLLAKNFKGKVLVVSDKLGEKYKDFHFCLKKQELSVNPKSIFKAQGDIVTLAVETSVLMQAGLGE